MQNAGRKVIWVVTISPNSKTFSPRTINTPQGMSQYMSSTILRSKVDWRTRFAGEIKKEIHMLLEKVKTGVLLAYRPYYFRGCEFLAKPLERCGFYHT